MGKEPIRFEVQPAGDVLVAYSGDSSQRSVTNNSAGSFRWTDRGLLAKHGENFIDRIEAEARKDPSFAKVLGGVWQNRMSDAVWKRLQSVWDRRGWDGVPE